MTQSTELNLRPTCWRGAPARPGMHAGPEYNRYMTRGTCATALYMCAGARVVHLNSCADTVVGCACGHLGLCAPPSQSPPSDLTQQHNTRKQTITAPPPLYLCIHSKTCRQHAQEAHHYNSDLHNNYSRATHTRAQTYTDRHTLKDRWVVFRERLSRVAA
jgi:hypothetical protein